MPSLEYTKYEIKETDKELLLRVIIPRHIARAAIAQHDFLAESSSYLEVQGVISFEKTSDKDNIIIVHPRRIREIEEEGDEFKKWDILEELNRILGAFVVDTANSGEADNAPLNIKQFNPNWAHDETVLSAELNMPLGVDYAALSQEVTTNMQRMAEELNSSPQSVRGFVGREEGVALTQAIHSSVHTRGDDYTPGDARVEVGGNNVDCLDQPLIALVGLIVIARANELA